MAELDTYTALSTAIGTWEERTFTSTETDQFIRLVEAKADRRLASDYRRRSTSTINTDSSGVGTIPTGFVGLTSITRSVLGSTPLKQVSHAAYIARNPYQIADDAQVFTLLSATQFAVAPVTDDDFVLRFSKVVTPLTSSNATNWLLALAPDFYLFGCQAAAAAKYKDYSEAAMLNAMADDILDQLVSQGNVAEYGNAEMTLDMVTP
jgi:hypothetical protein